MGVLEISSGSYDGNHLRKLFTGVGLAEFEQLRIIYDKEEALSDPNDRKEHNEFARCTVKRFVGYSVDYHFNAPYILVNIIEQTLKNNTDVEVLLVGANTEAIDNFLYPHEIDVEGFKEKIARFESILLEARDELANSLNLHFKVKQHKNIFGLDFHGEICKHENTYTRLTVVLPTVFIKHLKKESGSGDCKTINGIKWPISKDFIDLLEQMWIEADDCLT